MAEAHVTKTCRICRAAKDLDQFSAGRATCKPCARVQKQAYRALPEVRERERVKHAEWLAKNREQQSAKMRAANETPEGKELARGHRRRHYLKYRDIYLARAWLRRLDNPEWLQKEREINARYRAAALAKRRAAMRNALPAWADLDAIRAVYDEAKRLQQRTGKRYHVDHIVPLTHALVCGLHVAANLQPLPAIENQSKGNHWWPDIP